MSMRAFLTSLWGNRLNAAENSGLGRRRVHRLAGAVLAQRQARAVLLLARTLGAALQQPPRQAVGPVKRFALLLQGRGRFCGNKVPVCWLDGRRNVEFHQVHHERMRCNYSITQWFDHLLGTTRWH